MAVSSVRAGGELIVSRVLFGLQRVSKVLVLCRSSWLVTGGEVSKIRYPSSVQRAFCVLRFVAALGWALQGSFLLLDLRHDQLCALEFGSVGLDANNCGQSQALYRRLCSALRSAEPGWVLTWALRAVGGRWREAGGRSAARPGEAMLDQFPAGKRIQRPRYCCPLTGTE